MIAALVKLIQTLFWVIFFLPAVIALNIMYAAAETLYQIARRTRFKRTVTNNVRMVLPQSDTEHIADRLIKNISYSVFEVICAPFFKNKHFHRIFGVKGIADLEHAMENKKGVVMITLHAGNYELIPNVLTNLGYQMNSILRASDDPLFKIVNRTRALGGIHLINIVKEDMYQESLKALKRNEIVILLADTGALESRHLFYKFLGKEVPVATGWLTLAQRAECPVVIALAKREGKRSLLTLYEPFKVGKDRDEAMRKAGKIFEDFILENPQEWALFLNEFETKRMVQGN